MEQRTIWDDIVDDWASGLNVSTELLAREINAWANDWAVKGVVWLGSLPYKASALLPKTTPPPEAFAAANPAPKPFVAPSWKTGDGMKELSKWEASAQAGELARVVIPWQARSSLVLQQDLADAAGQPELTGFAPKTLGVGRYFAKDLHVLFANLPATATLEQREALIRAYGGAGSLLGDRLRQAYIVQNEGLPRQFEIRTSEVQAKDGGWSTTYTLLEKHSFMGFDLPPRVLAAHTTPSRFLQAEPEADVAFHRAEAMQVFLGAVRQEVPGVLLPERLTFTQAEVESAEFQAALQAVHYPINAVAVQGVDGAFGSLVVLDPAAVEQRSMSTLEAALAAEPEVAAAVVARRKFRSQSGEGIITRNHELDQATQTLQPASTPEQVTEVPPPEYTSKEPDFQKVQPEVVESVPEPKQAPAQPLPENMKPTGATVMLGLTRLVAPSKVAEQNQARYLHIPPRHRSRQPVPLVPLLPVQAEGRAEMPGSLPIEVPTIRAERTTVEDPGTPETATSEEYYAELKEVAEEEQETEQRQEASSLLPGMVVELAAEQSQQGDGNKAAVVAGAELEKVEEVGPEPEPAPAMEAVAVEATDPAVDAEPKPAPEPEPIPDPMAAAEVELGPEPVHVVEPLHPEPTHEPEPQPLGVEQEAPSVPQPLPEVVEAHREVEPAAVGQPMREAGNVEPTKAAAMEPEPPTPLAAEEVEVPTPEPEVQPSQAPVVEQASLEGEPKPEAGQSELNQAQAIEPEPPTAITAAQIEPLTPEPEVQAQPPVIEHASLEGELEPEAGHSDLAQAQAIEPEPATPITEADVEVPAPVPKAQLTPAPVVEQASLEGESEPEAGHSELAQGKAIEPEPPTPLAEVEGPAPEPEEQTRLEGEPKPEPGQPELNEGMAIEPEPVAIERQQTPVQSVEPSLADAQHPQQLARAEAEQEPELPTPTAEQAPEARSLKEVEPAEPLEQQGPRLQSEESGRPVAASSNSMTVDLENTPALQATDPYGRTCEGFPPGPPQITADMVRQHQQLMANCQAFEADLARRRSARMEPSLDL